jgi:sugar (pentulose or hexulose) kinase
MITKTKLNIVLDIGKTNVKLIFVDAKNTTVCSYKTQQKSINQYGIKTLNSNSIFEWTIKKISLIEKKYQLDKFVCTAHGCSIALIDHNNQEILACTDYEYKYDQLMNDYKKIAPKFDESFTPFLETGLNIGMQIYYLIKKNPKLIKNTKYIINYPQYIAWKFTNNFSSEASADTS